MQSRPRNNSHAAIFSPPVQRSQNVAIPVRRARGGYATDTEVGYTPHLARRSSQGSSSGGSPPSTFRPNKLAVAKESLSETERASPTLSVASSRQPQPLKLENIEYLLKQLDTNVSTSMSPTSSAEFSATEADRMVIDSERDGESCSIEVSRFNHTHHGGDTPSDCQFVSYNVSAVQSFNCNPLPNNNRGHSGSNEHMGNT